MRTGELMTTGVQTCREHDKLSAAVQTMWDHDLGSLPVVDRDGHLVGMITDRDIAMALHFRGAPPWAVGVADAMAKIVFCANADEDLGRALELMATHQLRRLPVVEEDGRLAGILSLAGLAQAMDGKGRKAGVAPRDVAELLAAITRPRPPKLSETIVVEVTREPALAAPADLIRPAKRGSKARRPQPAKAASKGSKRGKPARSAR